VACVGRHTLAVRRHLALLAVVGAATLFGTTGTAQALGPPETTPLGVGATRIIVGSIALWAFAGRRPDLTRLRGRTGGVLLGAVGVAAYQPGFFIGTGRSGVALGTIVAIGSGPLFAGALQWAWLRRRPSAIWAVATVVMIAGGVVLVIGRGGDASFSLVGTLGSLTAGFGYALFAIVTKRLIDVGVNSTEALAWQFSLGALLLVPFLATQPLAWLGRPSGMAMAAHLGVLATGAAYLLYGWGLRSVSTSIAVTLTLVEPVTAAVAAVVLLGERLRWFGWVGVGLVFGGLAIAGRDPDRGDVEPDDVLPLSA
jgi:DME family drug/metabolite transporter